MNINSSNLSNVNIRNRELPCEGPIAVPIQLDFTSTPSYSLNLLQQQQQTRISLVQTVFVDMSNATHSDLSILIPSVNQNIKAKRGTQGYYPVLCPNPVEMVFSVASSGDIVQVILINVSIAGVVWTA